MKRSVLVIIAAATAVTLGACGRTDPAPEMAIEAVATHATVDIEWENEMPAALERARSEGKPILVNFYADWCVWCKRLETTTLRDAKVASMLQNEMVPVSLDVEGDGKALSGEYQVDGLPTIIVLDAGGREIGRIPGYMPPDSFLERIEGFLQRS